MTYHHPKCSMISISMGIFALFSTAWSSTDVYYACQNEGKLEIVANKTCPPKMLQIGMASFTNAINATGWSNLEVDMKYGIEDELMAYAAGALEGAATKQLIYWHWLNTVSGYCDDVEAYCQRLTSFLNKNLEWMKSQINATGHNDPYWHQVKLVLLQLGGLLDGYDAKSSTPHLNIDPMGFLMFQIAGDLEEIEVKLNKPKESRKKVLGSGSCSALIKVVKGNSDLLVAHDTWSTYQSMLRILKLYKLPFKHSPSMKARIPGEVVTFSGYPGTLPSIDDFYLTSAGLAITETTIGNNNASRTDSIRPVGSVLTWIRSQIATRLATSAKSWAQVFKKKNSGTYNNQWMIVDYNQFKPKQPLPKKGLFYVLEQIPGLIVMNDMTKFLSDHQHWPSYNVPYYTQIFNESNSWVNVEEYGDWFTYDKTPRALIFKRDSDSVQDMDSLTHLMRSNNYQHDPLSRCNCTPPFSAENAISARCDLNPASGEYPIASLGHRSHGGIDMKATNSAMIKKLQFVAVSGPSNGNGKLPYFKWSEADFPGDTPHYAHPNLWNFQPIITYWKTQI